jgi:hypothetical protein
MYERHEIQIFEKYAAQILYLRYVANTVFGKYPAQMCEEGDTNLDREVKPHKYSLSSSVPLLPKLFITTT